ncbi:MAG: hypothetical protein ACYTF6_07385 [Planctomycetota bacterium]|jgi:hypothetical protein
MKKLNLSMVATICLAGLVTVGCSPAEDQPINGRPSQLPTGVKGAAEADVETGHDATWLTGKISGAAAATVQKAYPKATFKQVEVEHAGGINLHKVVMWDGERDREVEVSPDGILVSTQIDVSESELSKDMLTAVKEAVGGGKIIKIEREDIFATVINREVVRLPRAKTIYEAKYTHGGVWSEVKIAASGDALARKMKGWRSSFNVDKENFVTVGRNPYFILVPGHRIHLKEEGDGEYVIVTVLDETKVVDGVETRVVEEREFEGGKLKEVSRNYFAMDKATNDVYYFGEDVDIYSNGKVVGHGGAWLSGVKGAKFGLIMPGKPRVGDKYYQEYAPNAAMDRAEIVDLKAALETPFKTFKDCLYIRETSALEAEVSHKWYVAGIGMVGDDELRLVKFEAAK